MVYRVLADLTLVLHLLFILFVVFGALLVLKWRWFAFIHVPAAIWGALIEFMGWICPLTPLKNRFRHKAGQSGYDGGFIDHYLIPIIYPEGLTGNLQIILGTAVILLNLVFYWLVIKRIKKARSGNV
jgi:hypothetical protein